jgi:hypothetical protein
MSPPPPSFLSHASPTSEPQVEDRPEEPSGLSPAFYNLRQGSSMRGMVPSSSLPDLSQALGSTSSGRLPSPSGRKQGEGVGGGGGASKGGVSPPQKGRGSCQDLGALAQGASGGAAGDFVPGRIRSQQAPTGVSSDGSSDLGLSRSGGLTGKALGLVRSGGFKVRKGKEITPPFAL